MKTGGKPATTEPATEEPGQATAEHLRVREHLESRARYWRDKADQQKKSKERFLEAMRELLNELATVREEREDLRFRLSLHQRYVERASRALGGDYKANPAPVFYPEVVHKIGKELRRLQSRFPLPPSPPPMTRRTP